MLHSRGENISSEKNCDHLPERIIVQRYRRAKRERKKERSPTDITKIECPSNLFSGGSLCHRIFQTTYAGESHRSRARSHSKLRPANFSTISKSQVQQRKKNETNKLDGWEKQEETREMIRGRRRRGSASWMAGWTAGRLGACARVARGRQTEYPPVSPTLGTFVNPFVRLILISPGQLRKTTAAFLRARRLRRTTSTSSLSPSSLSRFASRSRFFSIRLSSPPLSFLFSPLYFSDAASVSEPRWRQHGTSCFPLARSRARSSLRHSSCSSRTLSRAVYPPCVRLSPPPSSYNLILSRGAAILSRPKRRHTYARFPLSL